MISTCPRPGCRYCAEYGFWLMLIRSIADGEMPSVFISTPSITRVAPPSPVAPVSRNCDSVATTSSSRIGSDFISSADIDAASWLFSGAAAIFESSAFTVTLVATLASASR